MTEGPFAAVRHSPAAKKDLFVEREARRSRLQHETDEACGQPIVVDPRWHCDHQGTMTRATLH